MKRWFAWLRPKPERFCLVELRGCMGHIRHSERWGTVLRRESRDIIGMANCPGLIVQYDDGEKQWHPSTWVCRADAGHLELGI